MCYNGCCTSLSFCEEPYEPECELCHGSGFICSSCLVGSDCIECTHIFVACECNIDGTEPERRETTSAEHEAYLAFITFLGEYNHE